jgi:hypothetical protein
MYKHERVAWRLLNETAETNDSYIVHAALGFKSTSEFSSPENQSIDTVYLSGIHRSVKSSPDWSNSQFNFARLSACRNENSHWTFGHSTVTSLLCNISYVQEKFSHPM